VSTGPSLYRRHRPRTFADVVGQEHVVRTLRHAVEQGKVHHAYLFVGSRGTGKTSMAKILAACLNCERGPTTEPCGRCESCVSIANATSLDVIEMDAASNNSVDDIRDLRERVALAPVSGRHKVYILDEAHMLSPQAWNAFLKTLEEPPPRTIFVLATTEAQKVLPTVVDRCHRFDFGRPSAGEVSTVLQRVAEAEQIAIDDHALALIARHATGSFRDALGTLEQLLTALVVRDPAKALRTAAGLAESGRDPGQVLRDLERYARELLSVQILEEVPPELRVTPDRDRRLVAQAKAVPRTDAIRLLDLISTALEATANGANSRIQLELVLIKAAAPEVDPSVTALLSRIERLEGGGEHTRPEGGAAQTGTDAGVAPTGRGSPAPRADAGAPAAETAAEAAPEQPSASADLHGAAQLWPAVVEQVKERNAMLAALLADARPVALTERELTLAFPSGADFLKRKAEQDEHRRATAEALRAVSGRGLGLRYELRDSDDEGGGQDGATGLSGEELVRRFVEEFDAEEILEEEPNPETEQREAN
jgi:DNA polymerase-3 subunit gamma/tau